MSGGTFRGRPLMKDLRLVIKPQGWFTNTGPVRPQLNVFDGERPVMTAYIDLQGAISAWVTNWGITGPTCEPIPAADVCKLMGWTIPA